MSADNRIVILGTWSDTKKEGVTYYRVPRRKVYRVAHVQAWDNLQWYEAKQPYNVGAYLYNDFKNCKVFESLEEAMSRAKSYADDIGYLEYGICVEDTDYVFFGD